MIIRPIGARFRALRLTALFPALALSSVLAAATGGNKATAYSTGCHSPPLLAEPPAHRLRPIRDSDDDPVPDSAPGDRGVPQAGKGAGSENHRAHQLWGLRQRTVGPGGLRERAARPAGPGHRSAGIHRPHLIHQKIIAMDGTRTFAGSHNLDRRSADSHLESGFLIEGASFHERVAYTLRKDSSRSVAVTAQPHRGSSAWGLPRLVARGLAPAL